MSAVVWLPRLPSEARKSGENADGRWLRGGMQVSGMAGPSGQDPAPAAVSESEVEEPAQVQSRDP